VNRLCIWDDAVSRQEAPPRRPTLEVGANLHADLAFPGVIGTDSVTCVSTMLDEASRRSLEVPSLQEKADAAAELLKVQQSDGEGKPVKKLL
jgi:hypothetical protein